MNDWLNACGQYVIELDRVIEAIDGCVDQLRLSTIETDPIRIHPTLESLIGLLSDLERMVVHRDELIRDEAAPAQGYTLREKLLSLQTMEAAALSSQVEDLGHRIEASHGRAVSLFVCQYHLHELTSDILRTLSNDSSSQTYQSGANAAARPATGSIFNDAA